MKILKCKFCETTTKTIRLLRRHMDEVHPKESSEIKESLALVDAKLQSLSEVTENKSTDGESDTNQSATTPNNFAENHPVRFLR